MTMTGNSTIISTAADQGDAAKPASPVAKPSMSADPEGGFGKQPVLLAVAPNGARKTTHDLPGIPVTPDALAREAVKCQAAGAAMMHVHVRDDNQGHSLDVGRYREALAEIRAAVGPDMLLQVTSEAVGIYGPDQQMQMIYDLHPEAVSMAVREIAPDDADPAVLKRFFAFMRDGNIAPQFILYTPDDARRFNQLMADGIIGGERMPVLYVLGRYSTGQVSHPAELLPFIGCTPHAGHWMLCAFGPHENACMMAAAALGGHARIGFENNHHLADGTIAPDNAALIAQARIGAGLMGLAVADGKQARRIMAPDW